MKQKATYKLVRHISKLIKNINLPIRLEIKRMNLIFENVVYDVLISSSNVSTETLAIYEYLISVWKMRVRQQKNAMIIYRSMANASLHAPLGTHGVICIIESEQKFTWAVIANKISGTTSCSRWKQNGSGTIQGIDFPHPNEFTADENARVQEWNCHCQLVCKINATFAATFTDLYIQREICPVQRRQLASIGPSIAARWHKANKRFSTSDWSGLNGACRAFFYLVRDLFGPSSKQTGLRVCFFGIFSFTWGINGLK